MLPWPPVRAPVDTIPAPPFPRGMPWVNVAPLRMDRQLGRPVLIEFWDFCRVHSLRTLPYVTGWAERYAGDGLRRWYGIGEGDGTAYFDLHAERDLEHAAAGRRLIEQRLAGSDEQALLAEAEAVLRGNWELLDGVERACGREVAVA